jgi:hypothetical protein
MSRFRLPRWSQWKPALGNAVVVTVVSILLWMWAAARTRETTSVTFFVQFVSSDAMRLAVLPLDPITVEVELQGSRRDLDRAKDRLSGKTVILRSGSPGIPATAGAHVIDFARALSRTEDIVATGVAITNTSPVSGSIELLETETIEAKVTAVLPGVQVSGPIEIEPDRVVVTLPKTLAPSLGADPHVEAYLSPAQTNGLQPGRRHAPDVPLRVPEALAAQARLARFDPERVRVAFTLASRSSRTTLRLVPVQIAGPPADLDRFDVTIDPADAFLRDVEVEGPSETIRALEDGRARALAFIHLSADELAMGLTRKRISLWYLPPNVNVDKVSGSTDTTPLVRLSISPRQAAGATLNAR